MPKAATMEEEKQTIIESIIEYVVTYHRGIFATLVLLPLSLLFDISIYIRAKVQYWFFRSPHSHMDRVRHVQNQLIEWKRNGSKEKLCTARPVWETMSPRVSFYKSTYRNIDLGSMKDILEVDLKKRVIRVEPLVNVSQIEAVLKPMGYTMKIMPELEDLTVGGLIMGYGVETSSHKYGLFKDICTSYELVLADGTLRKVTRDDDLFQLMSWSHGTLAFLVSAEIEIMPASKFVRLQYIPLRSQQEMYERLEQESNDSNDFVELIVFSRHTGVLMVGHYSDRIGKDGTLNEIGRWHKPWFYKHIESFLNKDIYEEHIEYIPLWDYYKRHNRAIFWEMRDIIPFGNHPLFRLLLGWSAIRPALLKLTQTKTTRKLYEANHVVHDVLIPITNFKSTMDAGEREWNNWPVWVCPYKVKTGPNGVGMMRPHKDPVTKKVVDMFVDICFLGTFGPGSTARREGPVKAFRNIEKHLLETGGYEALYNEVRLSREELRQMFDHTDYDKMREKLPLTKKAFPEVWEKVNKTVRGGMR